MLSKQNTKEFMMWRKEGFPIQRRYKRQRLAWVKHGGRCSKRRSGEVGGGRAGGVAPPPPPPPPSTKNLQTQWHGKARIPHVFFTQVLMARHDLGKIARLQEKKQKQTWDSIRTPPTPYLQTQSTHRDRKFCLWHDLLMKQACIVSK